MICVVFLGWFGRKTIVANDVVTLFLARELLPGIRRFVALRIETAAADRVWSARCLRGVAPTGRVSR